MICECPNTGVLATVPVSTCEVHIKQIQKILFWESGNEMTVASEDPTLKATWDGRIAAVDAAKVVATPLVGGEPIIEAGEAITEGGNDNSTLNGVELVTGSQPSNFSCVFKGLTAAQERTMKQWFCKTNLVCAFVNQDGSILMKDYVQDGTVMDGFPVQATILGDKGNQGFGTKDNNAMRFSIKEGWSESLAFITPEATFSPLIDIV